ncbi:MAG TPA: CopD family protein [Solirubrobacteraceae bacterium]|jgi:copper transport protein|nr:CopD family protein [Solirubrobacteraceae bacterium]
MPKRSGRYAVVVALALIAIALVPASAFAHAQLLGTQPVSGTTLQAAPHEVIFEFNQSVGGTLGAVRVYDAGGKEVDRGDVSHPDGNEHWMGVGLPAHLLDGTYTATYRVISADTHIVYGGLVFNIGHASTTSQPVAGLIDRNKAGPVTNVAFGVVRALDYVSFSLLIGTLAFILVAVFPVARRDERLRGAFSGRFASRVRLLLTIAVVLGFAVSVLGVLLQGAEAAGLSLWSSLKSNVISNTLDSRFGWVWGVRAIVWLVIAGALLAHRHRASHPAVALGAAYLVTTPALAGHASIQSPVAVFFAVDVAHVAAASLWVGGIATIVFALPAATRALEPPRRTALLLATLARFSPLALGSVIVIAATGIVQAYIDVRSLGALTTSTYGALVLIKTLLLGILIGLGAVNRERIIPTLKRLAGSGATPGETGVLLARTTRAELAAMASVFAVTAALVAYAPPIDAASGPFSLNTPFGPAEIEFYLSPARIGPNAVHLYMINAKTGTQFTATKQLTITAALPSEGIGPLPLKAYQSGPGHYTIPAAILSPAGTWTIEIVDRVSLFNEYIKQIKVPIR